MSVDSDDDFAFVTSAQSRESRESLSDHDSSHSDDSDSDSHEDDDEGEEEGLEVDHMPDHGHSHLAGTEDSSDEFEDPHMQRPSMQPLQHIQEKRQGNRQEKRQGNRQLTC